MNSINLRTMKDLAGTNGQVGTLPVQFMQSANLHNFAMHHTCDDIRRKQLNRVAVLCIGLRQIVHFHWEKHTHTHTPKRTVGIAQINAAKIIHWMFVCVLLVFASAPACIYGLKKHTSLKWFFFCRTVTGRWKETISFI